MYMYVEMCNMCPYYIYVCIEATGSIISFIVVQMCNFTFIFFLCSFNYGGSGLSRAQDKFPFGDNKVYIYLQ